MIRYEFQMELYGLTLAQRNQGISFIQNAYASETLIGEQIARSQLLHGDTCLFAEGSFTTQAGAERMFNQALGWAATRSTDANDGRHSYIWFKEVNDVARTITIRRGESPSWSATTSVISMDD